MGFALSHTLSRSEDETESGTSKDAADRLVRDIKRKIREHYSTGEKIRIVLAGLRGEVIDVSAGIVKQDSHTFATIPPILCCKFDHVGDYTSLVVTASGHMALGGAVLTGTPYVARLL